MCETCPAHIPGPGEVAGGVAGLAADGIIAAAKTKVGRRVMFWTLAMPMFLGILCYTVGWWLVPIAAGLAALAAGVLLAVRRVLRFAARGTVTASPEIRHRLAARGVPALAHGQARPALPRAMVRQLGRGRLAATVVKAPAPTPAQAIPAAPEVINPTRVLPARRAQ